MIETLKNAFRNKDIRRKIFITLFLLLVFRLGCYIPVPGLNSGVFGEAIGDNSFLQLMSGITGNALSQGTLFALGIGPYINASIIVQLLTVGIPALERLSKQGEEGKKRLTLITRIITVVLAIVQSVGIIINFANQTVTLDDGTTTKALQDTLFYNQTWLAGIYMAIVYTAGSLLVMWLGERITDLGVSNGISMIIFIGIISTAGMSILQKFIDMGKGELAVDKGLLEVGLFIILAAVIFFLVTFVDLAERKIPVHYAKQIKGRKQYGGQTTYIPIKVNASGVMPIIFATAILSFPQLICSLFLKPTNGFYVWWQKWLGVGKPIYSVLVGLLILFFSYFYATIQFNPEEVARNIQQYGGNITGLRPGKQTSDYLAKINKRLTLFGAIFLAIIAIVPAIIFNFVFSGASVSLVNAFSATGMLIVVSVALEFEKQLQSQLMMKQYRGFLK